MGFRGQLLALFLLAAIRIDAVIIEQQQEQLDHLPFYIKEYLADKQAEEMEEPYDLEEDTEQEHSRIPLQSSWSGPQTLIRERFFRNGRRFISPHEFVKRRLCIPPTMSCNLRPNACCSNSTCRCNLWGQNCRCLRMGIFQRWGKK